MVHASLSTLACPLLSDRYVEQYRVPSRIWGGEGREGRGRKGGGGVHASLSISACPLPSDR